MPDCLSSFPPIALNYDFFAEKWSSWSKLGKLDFYWQSKTSRILIDWDFSRNRFLETKWDDSWQYGVKIRPGFFLDLTLLTLLRTNLKPTQVIKLKLSVFWLETWLEDCQFSVGTILKHTSYATINKCIFYNRIVNQNHSILNVLRETFIIG